MNGCGNARLKSILAAVQRFDGVKLNNCSNLLKSNSMATASSSRKTAAILVIGDEILKGQTLETNSHFLCKKLYSLGVKVKRIVIIPDNIEEIAEHVTYLSRCYDYVLTSGGVGPTHDDITYESIAKAYNQKLIRHPSLVSLIKKYFGNDDNHPALKMSEVPENAEVLLTPNKPGRYPLVTVDNIYILPGVPSFMERSFQCFVDKLEAETPLAAPKQAVIYVDIDEVSITEKLNAAVKRFESRVNFGSYPSDSSSYYKVKITLESENGNDVIEAKEYLEQNLPNVVEYDADPVNNPAEKLYKAVEDPSFGLQMYLQPSITILTDCLTNRFNPSEVCISFNGGKDCTALLHLYFSVLNKLFPDLNKLITVLYIKCEHPFEEVEQFINETKLRYKLKMCTYNGSLNEGLFKFTSENPHIKAILMGNRRTDPNSKDLQLYQMTDPGWPQLMRVFPILDWSYMDLWKFIRHLQLPYCTLYDRGYTSLGSTENTTRNSKLSWVDGLGNTRYRPAYLLQDEESERTGRV